MRSREPLQIITLATNRRDEQLSTAPFWWLHCAQVYTCGSPSRGRLGRAVEESLEYSGTIAHHSLPGQAACLSMCALECLWYLLVINL